LIVDYHQHKEGIMAHKYLTYSLAQIIDMADKAYPDGLVKRAASGEKVGDTLVEFIVKELKDTFDPKATYTEQLKEAHRVMYRAMIKLGAVAQAFNTLV